MEVYVVIIKDRHSDTEVQVFSDPDIAVNKARELAKEYCRHLEDFEESKLNNYMTQDGWLYHAVYSCEGDNIRVVKRVVN